MKIKVGNEYLEFDADIDIEKQCKLFEEISSTQGDFSYSFEVPKTTKNVRLLRCPSPNEANKLIYSKIDATIDNGDGIPVYYGYIRFESNNSTITCSFFSGNNNWFSLLQGNVKDLALTEYDEDLNATNIADKFGNITGIIYPVINTGVLNTRSYISWTIEDFHAFIYVHDIVKRIFVEAGLKLTGELFTDWTYKHLITTNGNIETPASELTDRSIKVGRDLTTVYSGDAAPFPLPFNLTTSPYFVGTHSNWTSYRYTAEIKQVVNANFIGEIVASSDPNPLIILLSIGKNGTEIIVEDGGSIKDLTFTMNLNATDIALDDGDYLEVILGHSAPAPGNGSFTIPFAEFSVTPTYIYRTFAVNPLPDLSKQAWISEIFGMFNTLITYDPFTKTVNVDLFKNVIRREPIDISKYLDTSDITFDYTEFISNYGKLNNFLYSESSAENITKYNNENVIPYGAGQVDSLNEHAEDKVDVIELNAVAVMESTNNPLESFLPELDYMSLEEGDDIEITNVTNVSGVAQFNIAGVNEGDLIRISGSTIPTYNGDWVASAGDGSTYFRLRGVNYVGDADLTANKLRYNSNNDTDQIYLLSIPSLGVSSFSEESGIYIDESFTTTVATAYFYKPLQGLDVDAYRQSLSWGPVNIPNAFQLTLLQTYWKDFERILRDPVKPIGQFCFPEAIFRHLDFTRPVRLEIKEFQADLVINRISGYKNSYIQCEVELIKL